MSLVLLNMSAFLLENMNITAPSSFSMLDKSMAAEPQQQNRVGKAGQLELP